MSQRDRVTRVVFEAIEAFNKSVPKERHLKGTLETTLLGDDGNLDSVDFLNLAVIIEKKMGQEFKIPFTVFDLTAMTQKSQPFQSVGTLVKYLLELLEGKLTQDRHKASN